MNWIDSAPLQEIDEALRLGTPVSEIQDRIDQLPISDERRAALWLYARAMGGGPGRRDKGSRGAGMVAEEYFRDYLLDARLILR